MDTLRRLVGVIILIGGLAACGTAGGPRTASTPTATSFPFLTATERPSVTPTVATETPTPTATVFVPTSTPTQRPTRTPSKTPDVSASPGGEEVTATAFGPVAPCLILPDGIFWKVYASDPGIPSALGCTTSPPDSDEAPKAWPVESIYQPFERGHMLWLSNVGWFEGKVIYVLFDDRTYTRHDDLYDPHFDDEGDEGDEGGPPVGLYEPVGALGHLWRGDYFLRKQIGYGTTRESFAETVMQMFQYGEMVYLPQVGMVFVFKRGEPNTWSQHVVDSDE